MPADGITSLTWGDAERRAAWPQISPSRRSAAPARSDEPDWEPGRIVRITGFGGDFAETGTGSPGGRKRGSSRHWALSGELVDRIVAEWTVSYLPHKRREALAVLADKIQRTNGP
jgi:hypothetical protein